MTTGRDDEIVEEVEARIERARSADDRERLQALEEVQDRLESELGEGGEAQPPGR